MRSPFLVLLHSPLATVEQWGRLPEELREAGVRCAAVEVNDDDQPPYAARYIARASLEIAKAAPEAPLLLVAEGAAGALVPQVGGAQRAAHRPVAGYVLVDALLPQPGVATRADLRAAQLPGTTEDPRPARPRPPEFFTEPLPLVADWPDAPCGYLLTTEHYRPCARMARMRGWPVVDRPTAASSPAGALLELAAHM